MRFVFTRHLANGFLNQRRCLNYSNMSLGFAKKSYGLDKADLEALELSFSEEEDNLALTPKKFYPVPQKQKVVVRSPVKPHNQQFAKDFDKDFSEDSDDSFNDLLIRKTCSPSPQKKSITAQVRDFMKTPNKSSSGIKLSQLSSKITESNKKQKLDDLEDIFKDDMTDESQEKLASTKVEISALETSSPSYHRTETAIKRISIPETQKKIKNRVLTSSFLKSASDLGEPLVSSTQKEAQLYPTMDSYKEKYVIPPPEPLHAPPKRVLLASASSSKITTSETSIAPLPNFFDLPKPEPQAQHVPQPQPQVTYPMVAPLTTPQVERARDTRGNSRTPSVNSLLKKPKQNSEILLLTQRHSPFTAPQQARPLSTTPSNKDLFSAHAHQQRVKNVQAFSLSEEQTHVQNLVLEGKSLFYTGSAGTGKSVLLRSIIKALREKHSDGCVAVTASTGLAAVNIGGVTLHSFAGIGLGSDPVDKLIKKVKRTRKARDRWRTTKVLIIDEVSMISGDLFNKLDQIGRNLVGNYYKPFGGIQIVACGDFFQLPPVVKEDDGEVLRFCFDSEAWISAMEATITLKQVFRQKGDLEFIDMLNDMRLGIVSDDSLKKFMELERDLPDNDIEAAELYSTRSEVERANTTRLNKINSKVVTFNATDGGSITDPVQRVRMLSNFMAPERLELKKGAQVMMIKNIDTSLVNGSLGKVIDFMDMQTYLTYEKVATNQFGSDDIEREMEIAKLQEQRQDQLEQEIGIKSAKRIPPDEQVDELEDTIFGFMNDIRTEDPEVLENIQIKKDLIKKLHQSSREKKLPLVRFLTPDNQSRYVLVTPEIWTVDDEHQKPLVSRNQLPLILAWALSIHKSQGQTLPRVRVNLRKIFEKGQAYVAISRAVSREGLQVLNFSRDKVFAHPKVKEFYESLKGADDYKPAESLKKVKLIAQKEEEEEYEVDSFVAGDEEEIFHEAVSELPVMDEFDRDINEQIENFIDDSSGDIVINDRRTRKKIRLDQDYFFEESDSETGGRTYKNP